MGIFGFFKKEQKEQLNEGVAETKKSFFSKLAQAVVGKSSIDDDFLDDLEEVLIGSDVGVDTTVKIIDRIETRVSKDKYIGIEQLSSMLKAEISAMLEENKSSDNTGFEIPDSKDEPYVLMVVGVNGVGKTTTIGKLAQQFKQQGKKVLLGAADTFRAAAIEQLAVWGERADVPVVKKEMGSDPASVAFATLEEGKRSGADVIIVDTAGRLHNKKGLMEELSKIKRVMAKVYPNAPHDVMLVLDASTGQNAIAQAKEFTSATDLTCLALTKLDGTAKGGVVLGISDQFKIPIRYLGIGEKIEDLQPFNRAEFVDSLFAE